MHNLAIEYPAAREIHLVDLGAAPKPGPTEILLRTEFSGITNGTERHALLGEHVWAGNFPSRHGYQHVARVEAIGDDVREFAVGDRVFFGRYLGHRGWHIQDVGPSRDLAYNTHLCMKLPDDVDPVECALFGVAGVALRGLRRFRVGPGTNVWVVGGGLIGQFAVQCARAMGARVTVTEVQPHRLALACEAGAHAAIDPSAPDAWEQLKARGPFDCIVDTSGYENLLGDLLEHRLLAYRGVIGLLAVRTDTRFHWGILHTTEASIEVSCHFSLDDLSVLLQFLRDGALRVRPLITHVTPIADAVRVYEQLRDTPGDVLGVVFDWQAV